MQYTPDNGLYVYFRYDAKQTIMCVMNTSDKAMPVNFSKYTERTNGFTNAVSALDDNEYQTNIIATIEPQNMWVLELKK